MASDDSVRATHDEQLRERALNRLKKRRDLGSHLLIYTMVNAFLIVLWAVSSHGFFWPVFLLVGWGIGLVMNAWDVYRGDEFTEEQVAREMRRLRHT